MYSLFDPSRLPARDAQGFTVHPDLPGWGENEAVSQHALDAIGHEMRLVTLDGDGPEEETDKYFDGGNSVLFWNPTPPPGDGWKLAGIWDTEDGPVACFVRLLKSARPHCSLGVREVALEEAARVCDKNEQAWLRNTGNIALEHATVCNLLASEIRALLAPNLASARTAGDGSQNTTAQVTKAVAVASESVAGRAPVAQSGERERYEAWLRESGYVDTPNHREAFHYGYLAACGVKNRQFDKDRFIDSLSSVIADTQRALGISDEEAACANGSEEIVEAIEALKARAAAPIADEARVVYQWSFGNGVYRYTDREPVDADGSIRTWTKLSPDESARVIRNGWMTLPPRDIGTYERPMEAAQDEARDAARYRWLRGKRADVDVAFRNGPKKQSWSRFIGDSLDKKVDAAIAAERGDVEQERKP